MLKRQGVVVNLKRVRRLCRLHGLLLKQRRRRKRRGIGAGVPCRAEYPHHVWTHDFVEDRTARGRKLRVLTTVDEFTRECLELEVEHRMNARFVACTLLKLLAERGTPAFLRSDHGPEFIAKFLMRVLAIQGVAARHIEPGFPWQNGRNERFNGTLRNEGLNLETFHNRDQARALIKLFARQYNEHRPYSSLGYLTPVEFAKRWRQQNPDVGCADLGSAQIRDLSLGAPSGAANENGPSLGPEHPAVVHVGAPVASQQSRILRVDELSVMQAKSVGNVPTPEGST
ncbi:MAG TPA: IS3 family transposase [Tepidisphaeraceae bacterium]|nr:IS3 family transposase [Tepidisphaeraceae bacterium]